MKKIISFSFFNLCLILVISCEIKNKEHLFLTGEMVFEEQNIISNGKVFNSSIEDYIKLSKKMFKSLDASKTENSTLKSIESEVNESIKQDLIKKYSHVKKKEYVFKFLDSIILYYNNDRYYEAINRKTNLVDRYITNDSTKINKESSKSYKYFNEKNLSISTVEYRDSVKKIKGYNCYKVIFSIGSSKELKSINREFYELSNHIKEKYELYVTDKIKLKYHPTFKYKSILDKYFPLEIKKSSNLFEGVYTQYKLVNIK